MTERKPSYYEARASANAEWLEFVERHILPVLTWGALLRLKVLRAVNRKPQRGRPAR